MRELWLYLMIFKFNLLLALLAGTNSNAPDANLYLTIMIYHDWLQSFP